MDELPAPRRSSLRDHWLLLPILAVATLLRLWQINESLWLDELHSAWVVSSGVTEIAARAQLGNQSPLYFYLLWATTSLCGMSEWALRLPSLVAGVGLVALAYGLAYQFTRSPIAAIASSMLAALDHNCLFYATEARPYAWVQLIAAAQLVIFWTLQSASTTRRRIAFVVSSVALFYMHYTGILLMSGEVVYVLTRSWGRRQRPEVSGYTFGRFAIDLLCVAAMTLPMAAHLIDIGARRNDWTSFINNTSLILPVIWFSLISYVVVPLSTCLVCMVVSWVRRKSVERKFNWQPASLLVCWLGVPLAIVWLLTVAKVAPLYLGRYVIGAALAPILFAGVCVAVWESKRSQAIATGWFIAFALCSSGMITQLLYDGRLLRDRSENWRDAVRYVNRESVDAPVFVRSGLLEADRLATDNSEELREYCILPVTSIYNIERPSHEIRPLTTRHAGTLTMEDVKSIEERREAWFIINGTSATREHCRERITNSLRKHTNFDVILDEYPFGNVGVFRVDLIIAEGSSPPIDQPTSPKSIAPP